MPTGETSAGASSVAVSQLDHANVTIVHASRVITMTGPDTEAIAFCGERIVATGALREMTERYRDADVVGYEGATLLPGFNDAHAHLTMRAMQLHGVDVSAERTPDLSSLLERLRAGAAGVGPGEWLRASRYDHVASSHDRILERADLDDISPSVPIVLGHVGAHWGVVNSRALEMAGIDDDAVDPSGGSYGRDAAGHLTGFVSEQAYFDFAYPSLTRRPELAPDLSDAGLAGSLREAIRVFLQAGITSVGDAMVGSGELGLLQDARAGGELDLRVNAFMTYPHLDALAAGGVRSGFGDRWLRIGGIKAFVDGAVSGRSCAVAEPFTGTNDCGILTSTVDEFGELVHRAQLAGLAIAVHANGERAIDLALTAFERNAPGRNGLRHRIEHCSIVTAQLLDRMARLDVIAVPFAAYPAYHGDKLLTWYGPERAERMFAHRWMLDFGITVAGSSDHPCGPLAPLAGVRSMVERRSPSGQDFGLAQRISLREALSVYTIGSAAASGEQHCKGRLAPGYLADFVVVDDLAGQRAGELLTSSVLATWVGGECKYNSE